MRYRYIIGWIFVTGLSLGLLSCGHYLDAKPDEKWTLPSTAEDLQLLMDNYSLMNGQYPAAGEMMADNYYLSADDWNTLSENARDLYLWQKNDQTKDYWVYQPILTANVVLDNADNIKVPADSIRALRDQAKGSALFFRAVYFHALVQLFAAPYDKATAATDKGVPLRLSSSYKDVSVRASVQQCYDRIIMDLQAALPLLPALPQIKSRPSRPAVLGALARVYLDMRDYAKAAAYADSCLHLYNTLLDYNTLDAMADVSIPRFNPEVILDMISPAANTLLPGTNKTDTTLYKSYADNDLRKSICFLNNDAKSFKGDYGGMGSQNGYIFAGIVTDEMYLIRAEGRARAGSTALAMQDLNTLLEKRWRTGFFVPLTATDATEALSKILTERRKELLFRGTRWTDLRRLQFDPILAVTPARIMNGNTYTLPPHSLRYAMQIPIDVIALTNIPQNP
ncbi:RagB/SusD family nutrient uptake outer membrane protein [Chitinophaga agrisoli]|nr:RagB/SusD family nutrient uptake outer membrane protein [Chitinophaga agrisoli]